MQQGISVSKSTAPHKKNPPSIETEILAVFSQAYHYRNSFTEMGLIPAGMPQYYGVAPWGMYPANLIPQQSSQPPPRRPLTPSQQAGENQPPYQVCTLNVVQFHHRSHIHAHSTFHSHATVDRSVYLRMKKIFSTNCM